MTPGMPDRELLADADTQAAAERVVGEFRQRFDPLVQPALEAEAVRLGEESRGALHNPLRHQDCCAARHFIARLYAVIDRSGV